MAKCFDSLSLSELIQNTYNILYPYDLSCLSRLPIEPLANCILTPIQLIEISSTTSVEASISLIPMLNALTNLGSTIAYFIHASIDTDTKVYLAVKAKDIQTATTIITTTLLVNYPDIQLIVIPEDQTSNILNHLLINTQFYTSVSSITFIPKVLDKDMTINLMKQFFSSIGPANYTLMLLGTTFQRQCIYERITYLENLATELSQHAVINHTCNTRDFCNDTKSDTTSNTCSTVCTHTLTNNDSTANNISTTDATTYSGNGKVIDNLSTTITTSCNKGSSNSKTVTNSDALSNSETNTSTTTFATSVASGHEEGHSTVTRKDNKTVVTLINQITAALTRLYTLLYSNTFDFAGYFLSDEAATTIRSSYTYMGLFGNNTLNLIPFTVNTWCNNHPDFYTFCNYLRRLCHPKFTNQNCLLLSPTDLISTDEYRSLVYIPEESKKL